MRSFLLLFFIQSCFYSFTQEETKRELPLFIDSIYSDQTNLKTKQENSYPGEIKITMLSCCKYCFIPGYLNSLKQKNKMKTPPKTIIQPFEYNRKEAIATAQKYEWFNGRWVNRRF